MIVSPMSRYLHMKRYLKLCQKKLWFLRYLKALSSKYMGKRRNTSTEAPLPPMWISKLLVRIKSSFSVLHIKFLSFKDISCSMHLIIYKYIYKYTYWSYSYKRHTETLSFTDLSEKTSSGKSDNFFVTFHSQQYFPKKYFTRETHFSTQKLKSSYR